VSSVYEALQRARRGSSDALPLRWRPASPAERPPVWLSPGPLAGYVAPLLSALRPLLDGKDGTVIHVAAASAGEGASTIAREFAMLAGTSGRRRTLLLDADRRNPQTAKSFSCDTQQGLIDALQGGHDDAEILRPIAGTLLSVACLAGEHGPAIAYSDILHELYSRLREQFALTVVDCPAIGDGAYFDLLPEAVDGIVLVVQAEKTRPAVITHARDLVQQAGGHILGAVLNQRSNYIPEFLYRKL
jgi:Mrp family chromosome partitioning ATPase